MALRDKMCGRCMGGVAGGRLVTSQGADHWTETRKSPSCLCSCGWFQPIGNGSCMVGWGTLDAWDGLGADQEELVVSLLNARRPPSLLPYLSAGRLSMPSFTPGAPIPFLHFLYHPRIQEDCKQRQAHGHKNRLSKSGPSLSVKKAPVPLDDKVLHIKYVF